MHRRVRGDSREKKMIQTGRHEKTESFALSHAECWNRRGDNVGAGVPAGPKEWRAGTPAATKRSRNKQRPYIGDGDSGFPLGTLGLLRCGF